MLPRGFQHSPNCRIHALKANALLSGSEGGRGFGSVFHHQYLAPNCSQLGVSISTSRKPRAVRAHSACAMGMHGLGRRAVGSTLFCPLFSQNLHQLFRRGTRTLTFVAIAYVRASLQGFPADLDRRCMSRIPFTAWPHTALHTALRVPAYPREFGRRDEAPRIAPP